MEILDLYNREDALRARLNTFLRTRLQLPERDYYGELDQDSLAELKSVLSDINNIFTLKVCLAFAKWLGTSLNLTESETAWIERSILSKKASANGYDVEISVPVPIIGEVKCNVPINQGVVYGSAQQAGIAKDVNALLNGKTRSNIEVHKYLKFLVLLDTPDIRRATEHFFNKSAFKERVVFVSPGNALTRFDVIYVVFVAP